MDSLLNKQRPPAFCPGCSYERIVKALDSAFIRMGLSSEQVVLVTDIGCCGLLDVFFATHAFHGLHGRALTYAAGLKMSRPELKVVVIMGDGGIGIGGAHFVAACRRNLDLTLLVLNNFNYGMTGGQFSATTPMEAVTASGFLNTLERPIDICRLADAAGAPFAANCTAFDAHLAEVIRKAIGFEGFSVVDIQGICTGRFTRKNKLKPADLCNGGQPNGYKGPVAQNARREFGEWYREKAKTAGHIEKPATIQPHRQVMLSEKLEVVLLGRAGQRIGTAGELLATAGIMAGLQATRKNSHDITVMRGASISEVIFWPKEKGFSGIERPQVIFALGQEGVNRRKYIFDRVHEDAVVILAPGVDIPKGKYAVCVADFQNHSIREHDWALAALTLFAGLSAELNLELMKSAAIAHFPESILPSVMKIIDAVSEKNSVICKT